jgi:hypothetical protein
MLRRNQTHYPFGTRRPEHWFPEDIFEWTTIEREWDDARAEPPGDCPVHRTHRFARRSGGERTAFYRGLSLDIPEALVLTECAGCGEIWPTDDERMVLIAALEALLQQARSTRPRVPEETEKHAHRRP